MKYEVRVGDRTFEVEVVGEKVRIGNRELAATLESIPQGPLRRLVMAGMARTFAVTRVREGWSIQRAGRSWLVETVDERARSVRQLVGSRVVHPPDGSVRAPMPGLVLRVEVEEGQAVAAGTGLVVLEAMKMENEIRSPSAGTVRRILVTQGQAVDKGTALVELERQG